MSVATSIWQHNSCASESFRLVQTSVRIPPPSLVQPPAKRWLNQLVPCLWQSFDENIKNLSDSATLLSRVCIPSRLMCMRLESSTRLVLIENK